MSGAEPPPARSRYHPPVAKKPAKSADEAPKARSKAPAKASAKSASREGVFERQEPARAEEPRRSHTHPPPIPLGQVLGQPRALATLNASLNSGRIHHAWIFHGPPGVGKLTTALAFAAVLLDPTSQANFGGEWEADPGSKAQQLLAAGTHPDLQVVVKELARFSRESKVRDQKLRNIPNEVILEYFVEPATRTTSAAQGARAGKVFIIDEAELMDFRSQNTILKTLEEPPPGTVLILVTSSEDSLLPTIRSRSQRVSFGPLNDYAMRDWLKRSALEIEPEELQWLLAFAGGSPGSLLRAHQGKLFEWHRAVAPMLEATSAGKYTIDLGPTMASLVDQWAKDWVEAHENASKEAANKAGADEMFRLVAEHYRRALRGPGGKAPSVPPGVTARAFDAIREAETRLDANVDMKFVFEGLSADLCAAFAVGR